MRYPDLTQLADYSAIYCSLRQIQLGELLEERLGDDYSWNVDMAERRIAFTSGRGEVAGGLDFVASIAPGPASVLWSFAHPQMQGPAGARIQQYATEHNVPSIVGGEVPFPPLNQGESLPDGVAELAHQLAQVAITITGPGCYYTAPVNDNGRIVMLPQLPDLPPLRLGVTFARGFANALDGGVTNHRAAVAGLSALAGWPSSTDEQGRTVLTDQRNSVTVTYNEHGRVSGLEGHLEP